MTDPDSNSQSSDNQVITHSGSFLIITGAFAESAVRRGMEIADEIRNEFNNQPISPE